MTEPESTNAAILDYRRFLEARDGAPDVYRSTLVRREEFYRRVEAEPVRSRRVFDRDVYVRNVMRHRPERGLDPELLWILATAKANQAERFGVELTKLYGHGPSEHADPERNHVILQEGYHARTLADVAAIFGLPVPQRPPRRLTRTMIRVMIFSPFPERWTLPLVGFAEMMGCIGFRLLRDRGLELFADEPQVCARIRLLYDEILADEICHVGFVEAKLGPGGRRLMHSAFRRFGARMVAGLAPEFRAVVDGGRIAAALARPFEQAALAREFPGAAFAF
jgi:hypothetical protein